MGRVRSAFDTVNRRRIALKTIRPRCAGMTHLEDRFRREGWALAAIEHPGVPILFESSAEPEPFFTMEIVDGVALTAVLRQGKVEPLRALGLAIDLAGILHAAHEVGVIHRDVKPDNIVLGTDDRVRLLDFGACLLMPRFYQRHLMYPATPTAQRYATGELETVGTPGYTAPEVLEMRGGIGPRSDIYSVCVVLYEMLTGRRYESPATGRAPPIDRGEFPAALGPIADVLRRGTAREPSERPWSMADLVRVLEIIRAGLLRARRQRSLVLVAVAAVAATTAILGLVLHLVVGGPTVGELPAVSRHDALAAAAPTPPPGELRADERPADVQPSPAPPAGRPRPVQPRPPRSTSRATPRRPSPRPRYAHACSRVVTDSRSAAHRSSCWT
jgi:serine/threonine protein kinase